MRKFYILFIFAVNFAIFACSREEAEQEVRLVPSAVDVYVMGNESNWICYWKNGVKNTLPNSGDFSTEFMGFDGETIYACGLFSLVQNNGFREYSYWKGNTKENLNNYLGIPANASFFLTDFKVIDGVVYSAGYLYHPSAPVDERYEYSYWKNIAKTTLFKCKYASSDLKILVFGNDIYAAGDDGTNFGFYKNGIYYHLQTQRVKYFFEHNNEIYFKGYHTANYSFFYKKVNSNTLVNLPGPNIEMFSRNGDLYLKDAQILYKNSLDNPILDVTEIQSYIRKIDVFNGNTFGIFIYDSDTEQQRVFINQTKFMGSNSLQHFQDIIVVSK